MIDPTRIKRYNKTIFFMIVVYCLVFNFKCWAEDPNKTNVHTLTPRKLTLTVSKSTVIKSADPVKRVTLAAPEMADVLMLTPQQMYITGKAPGITSLTLWGEADKITDIFDLEVLPEINRLKVKLHEMFPQEENIFVTATHEAISLSGTVSSTSILSQVLALAQSYAPKDKKGIPQFINLLEVGGVQQVMLEVRVSEIARSLARRFGINFNLLSSSGQAFGITLLDNLTSTPVESFEAFRPSIGTPNNAILNSERINLIFRFLVDDANTTFFIDALKENGLIKILAEPTLITLSGKSAHFLAGGEFPVPVPQVGGGGGGTTITIVWKPFGVGLNFTPMVLSDGRISMLVAPEVSELDFTNAVSLQGFIIPALDVRRVSTTIELSDGQSFVIAGLLKDNIRETVQKYPLLGDVPVLGALFRSSQYIKNETELIVIVTPHLVRPVDLTKQTLPTDLFIDPNDFEFYLLGDLEGGGKVPPAISTSSSLLKSKGGGLEGDFGYIKPMATLREE
ncbi:MAG: type II and III secretion system protein family protein [Candidatus Scalinduaceae bacterium]